MLVEGGIFGSVADSHRVLVAFGSMGSQVSAESQVSRDAIESREELIRAVDEVCKIMPKFVESILLEQIRDTLKNQIRELRELDLERSEV